MTQTATMYKRIYVDVDVRFDPSGRMVPHAFVWQDGRLYQIDKVLEVRPAHAEKAGGQGDRYKVKIRGQERAMFFEHATDSSSPNVGRWFVEGKA